MEYLRSNECAECCNVAIPDNVSSDSYGTHSNRGWNFLPVVQGETKIIASLLLYYRCIFSKVDRQSGWRERCKVAGSLW